VPELKLEYLLLFGGFVLPGAISMYVYALKVPQKESPLKERVLEAICFSSLNFLLLIWFIRFLFQGAFISTNPELTWIIVFFCFVVFPAFWPFVLIWLIRFAESKEWIGVRPRTAWDYFFEADEGCWIQVVLNDDSVVGGRFDTNSYASAFPEPGHLYLEELWEVDLQGRFVQSIDGNPGILPRPTDYKLIKVFR
jgi:hypothetical protein